MVADLFQESPRQEFRDLILYMVFPSQRPSDVQPFGKSEVDNGMVLAAMSGCFIGIQDLEIVFVDKVFPKLGVPLLSSAGSTKHCGRSYLLLL